MKKSHQKSFISFLMVLVMLEPCYAQICPNPASIAPCVCSGANSISIDCNFKNLSDFQIGPILSACLAPGLSTVSKIMAKGNLLTKVPFKIAKFPYLELVDLSNNQISVFYNGDSFISNATFGIIEIRLSSNQITSIPSGVFLFPLASSVRIDLSNNQIASISQDAFRFPSAVNVFITLTNNQISVLPDGVFTFPASTDNVMIYLQRNKFSAMPSSAVFNFPSIFVYINLDENAITSIPCTSQFSFPRARYFVGITLNRNQISTVPSCAFNFPTASTIFLELGFNVITTISPGAFNFPSASLVGLHLHNNQISSIPPNSFSQGKYNYISLGNNQLKRLESNVFKAPLMKSATVDIRGNPLDCTTDPCHLTWLLRGKNIPQVLNSMYAQGSCSNSSGIPYAAIASFDFDNICTCACCN